MSEAINGSSRQRVALSAPFQPQGIMERTRYDHGAAASFPFVIRYARRHLGFLAGLVVTAIAVGVVYRYSFDQLEERTLSYYLRSCLHAIGLALSGWAVLLSFSAPQLHLRSMLRRLPQIAELAIKALAMTAVLTIAAVGLQLVLYPATFFSQDWLVHHLPSIVAISFSVSLVTGAIFEFRRLIGGRVLGSFVLGTYHRPRREHRIVMFLDIAGSTTLAEQLGEVRVHDLITSFFFDIARPIAGHDGEVHAYVGDEVIVTWPLSDDTERNARSLRCFFAAQDTMADLAPAHTREFGVAPRLRAGIHAGRSSSASVGTRSGRSPISAIR